VPVVKVLQPDGRLIDHPLDCSASCSTAFNAVEFPLRRRGQIRDFRLGDAKCFLMKGRDVIDAVVAMIRDTPDILFCTRPECRCCAEGRRYLRGPAYAD